MTALSAFNEGTLDLAGIDDVQAGDKVLLGISDRNSAAEQSDALEDQGIESENMYVRLNSFPMIVMKLMLMFNLINCPIQIKYSNKWKWMRMAMYGHINTMFNLQL